MSGTPLELTSLKVKDTETLLSFVELDRLQISTETAYEMTFNIIDHFIMSSRLKF